MLFQSFQYTLLTHFDIFLSISIAAKVSVLFISKHFFYPLYLTSFLLITKYGGFSGNIGNMTYFIPYFITELFLHFHIFRTIQSSGLRRITPGAFEFTRKLKEM